MSEFESTVFAWFFQLGRNWLADLIKGQKGVKKFLETNKISITRDDHLFSLQSSLFVASPCEIMC